MQPCCGRLEALKRPPHTSHRSYHLTPHTPTTAATLPAIWLRLEALKAGVRVKVALGVSIRMALGQGGGGAAGVPKGCVDPVAGWGG